MIHHSDLSGQTQRMGEIIYDSADKALDQLSKNFIKNISDKIYDEIHESFNSWFARNLSENYLLHIQYEVRNILREFLNGNVEVMKNCNLLSEYTFDNLHEIRLAIWKAGSDQIESSIIKNQQEKIEELKKQLENERRYRR